MKRIFMLSSHSLLGEGVQVLLRQKPGLAVVGTETDVDKAIERIKELVPDVVLLEYGPPECDAAPIVMRLFKEVRGVKIVGLNLQDNTIHIYRGEQRRVKQVEDLMDAIENDVNVAETAGPADWANQATYRSRVYGFLAALFNRLPDDPFAANLSSLEVADFLSSLAEGELEHADMWAGVQSMQQYIRASKGKPVETLKMELAVERTRLVRGLDPQRSPVPPYESNYLAAEKNDLVQGLVKISRTYAESGVGLPEPVVERPDFIGLELDFMRHLTKKESEAWSRQDREEVSELIAKEHTFLDEHLTRWIPMFCDAMFQQAEIDFYRGVARMTKGFVLGDAQQVTELNAWARAEQAA